MTENELVEQRTRLQMLAVALTAVVIALAAFILLTRKGEAPPLPTSAEAAGAKSDAGIIRMNPQAQREANLAVVLAASSVEKDTIRANGQITVNENETWHVGALAEGKVMHVLANIGDHVNQGQVLALMHSHTVHETRAAYIQAQAELDRAIAHREMARRVAERAQRLLKVEAISQEQADQAANDLRSSETNIVKARADLEKEKQHMTEFLEIDPVGTRHASDATDDPDAVPIKAPSAGVILRRLVSSGSVLSVGQEAFTISNLNSLWVIAGVNEADLAAVRPGMLARISVRAFPERTFAGTVLQLGEELDPATRTLKVRINLPNPQGNLKPEMFAQVDLEQGESRPALYIPESAVEDLNGQKVAFVQMGSDSFQVRTLKIGATTNGQVEVTGGINEGERVVTRGAFALKSELLKTSLQGE
ncbi:efflux RND transporter periplasmic adaptor subunit [uncultured Paludibaculum sp.]|uniref:efflux RND transporter periplasmic adaptor subunit n=1 Tax=uncultured Paludibaculum sp. TaxID=1765020 RepID=UPI002AAA828B|nr:efflux RND transporter periplasmic adaptor subunit [uncultured Paludibaculum sp.]